MTEERGPAGTDVVHPEAWWKDLPRKAYGELEKVGTFQGWFEVYRVAPGVFALYEDGQFEETLSYLILGKERAVLLDTGDGIGDIRALTEELTDLPVSVVNTHHHIDHVAQNYRFDDVALFDDPYARRAAERGFSHEEAAELIREGLVRKPFPAGFDPATYHMPPFRVTRWLHQGDEIDLGGRVLEVIHTPGHSSDSICLLDREARLLWTGDLFYTGSVYTYLPGGNLDQFVESYEKILRRWDEYDRLLPSHNEPWVEKELLREAHGLAVQVRSGGGIPQVGAGGVRKYQGSRFALIVGPENAP
ncbi:MBL fold metallo-hydrolase [Aminomonas paucivorans]|uniref:MBL fold metallo-hydrolase n=1 Tax=Aminomonas paucivorans TaxID=81412 RepID=UPI0033254FDF